MVVMGKLAWAEPLVSFHGGGSVAQHCQLRREGIVYGNKLKLGWWLSWASWHQLNPAGGGAVWLSINSTRGPGVLGCYCGWQQAEAGWAGGCHGQAGISRSPVEYVRRG